MIRRLALASLGAIALVLAMAAATLAGQHNAPPTIVAPTPATSMTMPAITVSTPDIGYVAPARATRVVSPNPILPPLRASDIMPLQRSTRAVLATKRHNAKPRLRSAETRHPNDAPDAFVSTPLISNSGGRGFL